MSYGHAEDRRNLGTAARRDWGATSLPACNLILEDVEARLSQPLNKRGAGKVLRCPKAGEPIPKWSLVGRHDATTIIRWTDFVNPNMASSFRPLGAGAGNRRTF